MSNSIGGAICGPAIGCRPTDRRELLTRIVRLVQALFASQWGAALCSSSNGKPLTAASCSVTTRCKRCNRPFLTNNKAPSSSVWTVPVLSKANLYSLQPLRNWSCSWLNHATFCYATCQGQRDITDISNVDWCAVARTKSFIWIPAVVRTNWIAVN